MLPGLHDENQFGFGNDLRRDLACAVSGDVDTRLLHEFDRNRVGRMVHERTDTGRMHHETPARLASNVSEEAFGHGTAADIADTDSQE